MDGPTIGSTKDEELPIVTLVIAISGLFLIAVLGLGAIGFKISLDATEIASNQRALENDCKSIRIRTANGEAHVIRHANIERAAAARGYKTSPEWEALADDDLAFEGTLTDSFPPNCGARPTPYPAPSGYATLNP